MTPSRGFLALTSGYRQSQHSVSKLGANILGRSAFILSSPIASPQREQYSKIWSSIRSNALLNLCNLNDVLSLQRHY